MKKTFQYAGLLAVLMHSLSTSGIPIQVPYSGQLADDGELVNGTRTMQFAILDAEIGGTTMYDSGTLSVPVSNGAFSVVLGGPASATLDSSIFNGNPRWLEISVAPSNSMDFSVLSPRQPVRHTPHSAYAFSAGSAANASALGGQSPDSYAKVALSNLWSQPQSFSAGLWTPEINSESSFSIVIPRIGHEVIVDFLEGDPDRPIMVGRVYNHTDTPPYHGASLELRAEDAGGADRDGGHLLLTPGRGTGTGNHGAVKISGPLELSETIGAGAAPVFSVDTAGNVKARGLLDTRGLVIQYRESEYDFICRLMEEEGIYYYFQHNTNDHSMVFSVDNDAPDHDGQSLQIRGGDAAGLNRDGGDLILAGGSETGSGIAGRVRVAQDLDVTGGVTAISFSGSGSGLTQLDPSALSSGIANINISGNAATASSAGNAMTLDGFASSSFPRLDTTNVYSAFQIFPDGARVGDVDIAPLGSNIVFRSNVFAVWCTVGFFEVNLDTPGVRLGAQGTATNQNGARLQLAGGDGKGTNRNGGDVWLSPGAATGSGQRGQVVIDGPLVLNDNAWFSGTNSFYRIQLTNSIVSKVEIGPGAAQPDGAVPFELETVELNYGTNRNGGSLRLQAGNGTGTDANGGDLVLSTGAAAGSGTNGSVRVNGDLSLDSGSLRASGHVSLGDSSSDSITLAGSLQGSSPLVFDGVTLGGNQTTLAVEDPTAPRTVTLPDASGTVVLAGSDVTLGSPAPSVNGLTVLALEGYGAPTRIAELSGGVDGQVIMLIGGNNPLPPTLADDNSPEPGNFRLRSNLDWQALPNHTLTLARHNGVWYETARSEN